MIERDGPAEPPPLPADARALLSAYRKDEAMPVDARRRVWREVKADPPQAPRTSASTGRWGWWVGGGLAAAAMVLLGVHLLDAAPRPADRAMDPRPQTAPDRAVSPGAEGEAASRKAPTGDRSSPPSARVPVDDLVAPVEAKTSAAQEPARPVARGSSSKRAASSREPTTSGEPELPSDLAAERELIAAAWRALAKGSPDQARSHAEAHARRFPRGMLAPEREAVDAIATCREAASARPELAAAFERAHPHSPLGTRVRDACDRDAP